MKKVETNVLHDSFEPCQTNVKINSCLFERLARTYCTAIILSFQTDEILRAL